MAAATLVLAVVSASALPGAPGGAVQEVTADLIPAVPPERVSPRNLERITRRYLGTRYLRDALGEQQGPDPDPVFRRDGVDCQTFVEQTLAEALATTPAEVRCTLIRLRYHGGKVRLDRRFHYCLPEWLDNPWPVRDMTRAIAGRRVQQLRVTIQRERFLRRRGCSPEVARQYPPLSVRTHYIPSTSVPWLQRRLPDGGIAVFILRVPKAFGMAGHMGWLFRRGNHVILRHASQRQGRVVDESLLGFLRRGQHRFRGLVVLQPDVARWRG
ncbi:MAG: DUF1460 domain-containing protein [Armatimonadetes bacterium]|nr:DUF1460 domain-containing protein [Armatimonadota bacterium]